jgi:hypothetical protein
MASNRPPSGAAWYAALEEIRSKRRAILEAVQSFRASCEERLDRLDRESRQRDDTLILAIGELLREVRRTRGDIVELRHLAIEDRNGIAELTRLGADDRGDIAELKRLVTDHGSPRLR